MSVEEFCRSVLPPTKIKIRVLELGGTYAPIEIDPRDSVGMFQERLAALHGQASPLQQFKLLHNKAVLAADVSLADAGVKDGDQLTLVKQAPPLVATVCSGSNGPAGLGKIWNAVTGECLHTLQGHTHVVFKIKFSKDGMSVFTCSVDHTVKKWSTETGECERTFTCSDGQVNSIDLSHDGSLLLAACDDAGMSRKPNFVKIFSLETGECIRRFRHEEPCGARDATFSPDNELVVSCCNRMPRADGGVTAICRIWPVCGESEECLLQFVPPWQNEADDINCCSFSPNGKWILTGFSGRPRGAVIASAETGECLRAISTGAVHSAEFSPDGVRVLTACDGNTATIWTTEGECLQVLAGHGDKLYNAKFSSDGEFVVTSSYDKTAKVWSASTGLCLQTLIHEKPVNFAAFGP